MDQSTAGREPPGDGKPTSPSLTPKTAADKTERANRVAAEMRKNLLKRKQQQRSKQQGG